jgi:hypothetical protein
MLAGQYALPVAILVGRAGGVVGPIETDRSGRCPAN